MTIKVWTWRLWRLAWANKGYRAIGGWRRLFWRLWWRYTLPKMPPIIERYSPDWVDAGVRIPSGRIMHWCPDPTGYPVCNAARGEPWTYDMNYVTCVRCQEIGWPVVIQHHVNTR